MNWKDHITVNPDVLEFVIERLAQGWSEKDLLENYPRLTLLDLQAVFCYIQEH